VAALRIRYSDDVDIITINLREGEPVDSVDLAPGVILHLSREGLPLEIEILDASKLAELGSISFEDSRMQTIKRG
jgi:uncharacterized protein YuzE